MEDMLCRKAFIMERERYDGADIAHLLQANAEQLDWAGLLERFGPHWRVLLAHLTLFGYIYPGERHRVPRWVMDTLLARLSRRDPPATGRGAACLCRHAALARAVPARRGAARLSRDMCIAPFGPMTAWDVACWTEAIPASNAA